MEQRLEIEYNEAKMSLKRTYKISPNDCRYLVYLKFCCEPSFSNHIIRRQHSPEKPLIQTNNQPPIETLVFNFDYDEEEKGREIIERELRDWPVKPEAARRWLIDCAMKDVEELFDCMPPDHDTLLLKFLVRANYVRVSYEQEDDVWMVPADHESPIDCSICLDEILIGAAEGLPCSHVFHQDCINKWLNTSHSCPVCRYQMMPERV
ncbi:hypothetical protein CASFOL_012741 [Castilleja foliolosa]|uniref:RING-type E3 ubiquitin transferase n=1 Tax=Castilleja foliolosa TaxID=1961234 RepID=A0ABD3DJT1_9LAMI